MLSEKFKEAQEEMIKAKNYMTKLEQDNKSKAEYIEKLKVNYEKVSREHEKIGRLFNDQMGSNGNLWEENKELKIQMNNAKEIITELNDEVKKLKPQLERILPENEKLKYAIENAKQGINKLIQENSILRSDRDNIKSQLQRKLKDALDENDLLSNKVSRVTNDNELLNVSLIHILGEYAEINIPKE